MQSHAQHAFTIRFARDEDARALGNLASLDSSRPLGREVILAEDGVRPLAAIDVLSGRVIADPFRRTSAEADLLRARAAQLRSRPRRARGRRRLGRRAIGRLAGVAR